MSLILKNNKIFEWIDWAFINLLIDNSKRIEAKEWEYIITQWSKDYDSAYIIQLWEVSVIMNWKKIKTLWEWDIFWEISLITKEPRTASIITTTNSILLKINKKILNKIIKELKNWKEIQKNIFNRIMENNKKTQK